MGLFWVFLCNLLGGTCLFVLFINIEFLNLSYYLKFGVVVDIIDLLFGKLYDDSVFFNNLLEKKKLFGLFCSFCFFKIRYFL